MRRPTHHQELRHIVDVDGQLIGFDSPVVRACQLLDRAGIDRERRLAALAGDREVALAADQLIELSEREVLYFRSTTIARGGSFLLRAA